MFDLMAKHSDWIELAMHGWNHESNFECYGWDYDKADRFIKRAVGLGYKKIFKAPGWTITPDHNGYPAGEHNLIHQDKQAVYKALLDNDFIIFDRHYNVPARIDGLTSPRYSGSKIVCVDCQERLVHFHTWDMETGDEAARNGFQQIENEKGVPWDNKTVFKFVSEAYDQQLFTPCKK